MINTSIKVKKIGLLVAFLAIAVFCYSQSNGKKIIDNVNVFIGTDGLGHCFPGATVPFGMVQLSPDNELHKPRYAAAGYQYQNTSIIGFSHTHLSGTGPGSMLDVMVMATTGELQTNSGTKENPEAGFRSMYSKETEKAHPGYYEVTLNDYDIDVALTVTRRCGFHKYRFPKSNQSNILIDMGHHVFDMGERVLVADLEVVNDTMVRGFRLNSGWWAVNRYTYFVAVFSKPFKAHAMSLEDNIFKGRQQISGQDVKSFLTFDTKENEEILVKVGISAVDYDGATNNLQAEIPHWNFDKIKQEAENAWEKQLSKIQIKGADKDQSTIFYTALYHTCLGPYLFSDVDGRYRSVNWKTYCDTTYEFYSTFSLWDTYRATHPLFTIIERNRTRHFVKSLLDMRDQHWDKILPIWPLGGTETYCMIGFHAASVIAEAHKKGITGFDPERAYEALRYHALNKKHRYLEFYDQYGFIPYGLEHPNIKNETKFMNHWAPGDEVSKTLEYTYDDYCVATMAQSLKKDADYDFFIRRSGNYKNLFHPKFGVFAPRNEKMEWNRPFDPYSYSPGYTEALPIQYAFATQHDIKGYINLLGGYKALEDKLDEYFTKENPIESQHFGGKIGYYSHGNEPSHHVPYLYNYIGKPWKTQYYIHRVLDSIYTNQTVGFPGNDDMGQMSAWYVLSAMGFYPVSPASGNYVIGTPLFEEALINLENGKQFVIKAKNVSKENIYIQSCKINGKKYEKTWFTWDIINNGGVIEFNMGSRPNKTWATQPACFPPSVSE